MGSAISVTASGSQLPTTPTPGFPASDCATSRLANRFFSALSGAQPMPVSATVAAASSSAWPAICAASAAIRPSISPSCQPAMLSWAATDRATSASANGSGSPVTRASPRSPGKTRAFSAAMRDSQRGIMTPVARSLPRNSRSAPAARRAPSAPAAARRRRRCRSHGQWRAAAAGRPVPARQRTASRAGKPRRWRGLQGRMPSSRSTSSALPRHLPATALPPHPRPRAVHRHGGCTPSINTSATCPPGRQLNQMTGPGGHGRRHVPGLTTA